MNTIPLPFNLSKLEKDRRGLPIPFIVYRDKEGNPHFTINDISAMTMALAHKLCGLCGKPHKMGKMWFIGGPTAAFHENGLYIDPPVHEECGRYAMQVCPFIAAPNYSKRIDDKTLKPENRHDSIVVQDNQMDPSRPPMFIFSRTSGYKLVDVGDETGQVYIQPRRPFKEVEFWQQGKLIAPWEAEKIQNATEHPVSSLKWWPL